MVGAVLQHVKPQLEIPLAQSASTHLSQLPAHVPGEAKMKVLSTTWKIRIKA